MQTVIRVEKLSKTFNHNKALHAVDLTVRQETWWRFSGLPARVNPPFCAI